MDTEDGHPFKRAVVALADWLDAHLLHHRFYRVCLFLAEHSEKELWND